MEILALIAGVLYGMFIGIVPSIGATTGLITLYGVMPFFLGDPYLGVIFLMAVIAASTTGDSFTSILLGIPGANSAAATMVDGFPLAKQGRASYAISAAVTTSTVNGLLWGALVFLFFPYYGNLLLILGIPELWGFTVLALATVGFISTSNVIRSIIAIIIGIVIGMVGVDPTTNAERFTFGWFYLQDGIQLMPVVAGLFAIPELLNGFKQRQATTTVVKQEVLEGMKAVWQNRWLALKGGCIGAFIGLLPGLGGAVSDWMAYGSAVASNPNEKFGNGNIKGVIGPEGSNNAQKATSMVPTVLFGIPGAPFAAVLMGLLMYLGIELGTPDLVEDTQFFYSMSFGFLAATVIVAIISLLGVNYICKITAVPYKYYFPLLLGIITWACMQYTGGWEDLAMLIIFSILGLGMKRYKYSRPAMLMAFILADKIENLTIQLTTLYTLETLITRPIFIGIMIAVIGIFIYSLKRKNKVSYG
jgi:TctA family transporter